MKLNISKKITLFTGAIILLVAINVGLTGLLTGSSIIIDQQGENALLLADEGAKRIDVVISTQLQRLLDLARNDRMTSMNWDMQKGFLGEQLERYDYLDLAVVQMDGTASYVVGNETAQLGDRDYVQKAFQGQSNVSDILVSKVIGIPVVMYAVPIESGGKIIGALVARRDADALSEITDQLGVGERGYAFVVGADSTLYAHPDKELVMNQTNVYQEIEGNGALKNFGMELKKLGTGNRGLVRYEYLGEKRFTAMSPIPNTNWTIGVGNFEQDVLAPLKKLQGIVIIVTVGYLIFGLLAGGYLGRLMSRPIRKLLDAVGRMAQYDFTGSKEDDDKILRRKDEIGEIASAVSKMRKSIASLVGMVHESTQHVAASSQELTSITQQASDSSNEMAKTIDEIARGASEQAKDTEEGARNVFDLSALIAKERQNIDNLNRSAADVNQLKNEGLGTLQELTRKNEESKKASEVVFGAIHETNISVEKIEQGSEMIKTIAKQTNLLALNAAIEAARAGETGKGFAVVADEIRVLAEQSNRFASEISKEIEELSHNNASMVNIMNQVGSIMDAQNESVNVTNRSFKGIDQAVEKMKEVIGHLNESSDLMEKKKEELLGALNNLSAVSEEFAAGTEEAAATVEEQSVSIDEIAKSSEGLSKLAEELQTMASKFKL